MGLVRSVVRSLMMGLARRFVIGLMQTLLILSSKTFSILLKFEVSLTVLKNKTALLDTRRTLRTLWLAYKCSAWSECPRTCENSLNLEKTGATKNSQRWKLQMRFFDLASFKSILIYFLKSYWQYLILYGRLLGNSNNHIFK